MTKPSTITEGAVFDLAVADRELRTEDAYRLDGHTARTLVREPAMRVVLVVMKAGAKIAQHRSHDTASIHALSGHVKLSLPDRTVDLPAGQLLVIAPDLAHDVEAVVESRLLITLAHR
jgi:quercetin dioxygenase-like cupin family protein